MMRSHEIEEMHMFEEAYESMCENRRAELWEELDKYKKRFRKNLTEIEWHDLSEYIREYEMYPDTDFNEVIEDYIEALVGRYDTVFG